MTITYNKLVRDRIPEIIAGTGKTCITEKLPDDEYLAMLDRKLDEELAEFHEAKNIEELADLLEVLRASASALGYTPEELEAARRRKYEARGGFDEKILLVSVSDAGENA